MVKFSQESPFVQDDGTGDPAAVASQHLRSLDLLKTLVQVDTVLAGFLVLALVGRVRDRELRDDEKVSVVLLTVTCAVFLAAIVHTTVLMICTGWRYTLAWYDPLFPAGFSAVGFCLLVITIADAVLIQIRPDDDLDSSRYWVLVIFGLCMPMALAGPTVTLQMVLHKFSDADPVNGEGGVL